MDKVNLVKVDGGILVQDEDLSFSLTMKLLQKKLLLKKR